MKVLVVGNGGREHALCNSIQLSRQCEKLFCIPGSEAIASIAECHPIKINDNLAIVEYCKKHNIAFVVVGPEGGDAAHVDDPPKASFHHGF